MSGRFDFTYTGILVAAIGVALLIVGGLIAYFAVTAVVGKVSPSVVTPIGVVIAIVGLVLLTSKGD